MELYNTPVYKVFVKGGEASNATQIKEWPAVRFMPYWNDPKEPNSHYRTKGWVNAGLHKLDKRLVTYYNPNYGTQNRHSPHRGAIQLRDSFLIHAGPSSLRDAGWGSAGCVEIIGDFSNFLKDIKTISGSTKSDTHKSILDLVKAKKFFVEVEYEVPPDFRSNLYGEVG